MSTGTKETTKKHIPVCILGPDKAGLLAVIAQCGRRTRVDLTNCTADAHRGRAVVFFGCEGNDAELAAFCRAIEETFPSSDVGDVNNLNLNQFTGYSVDVRDVPRFVADGWSRTKLILNIVTEDAIGLLANVAGFLSREGFNIAFYRAARFYVDDETEQMFSRHSFEIRAPLGYFDREAFERKLLSFKQEQFYHLCELRDP